MQFVILYGSTRQGRTGIRLVRYFQRALIARGHQVEVADALELDLPMLPMRYRDMQDPPPRLNSLSQTLSAADGFLVVAGEYNHSLQPGLANLIDYFLAEWRHKPSAIASYSAGGYGGVRAAMALRPKLAVVGASSIPTTFAQPQITQALDEDGTALQETVDRFAGPFLAEFEWYARALAEARARGLPES